MRIVLESNDERLHRGLKKAEAFFRFDGDEVIVYAQQKAQCGYTVKALQDGYAISYGNLASFYRAIGAILAGDECDNGTPFQDFGVMIDCARNGVPNVEALKRFIATLAFSGYTYLGLYLEDCFEVKNEPYFGYMRGRYTTAEIKEVVDFAEDFGVEIVPYIQTLAHLARLFVHWYPYHETVRDTNDILLIGADRTYELIENMLISVKESFGTKRINLGMDEAFMMGLGKYRKQNGIPDRYALFLSHVDKVLSLCEKHGFNRPSVWGDMFVHYAETDQTKSVPNGLTLTVWNYGACTEEEIDQKVQKAELLTDKVAYATGAHKWYGYAPLNLFSEKVTIPAVRVMKHRTDDFCVTMWSDDGAECSYNALWYTLLNTANEAYDRRLTKKQLSALSLFLTGYTMPELAELDLPNTVYDTENRTINNPSKYTLYIDPLYGIVDKVDRPDWGVYFRKNARRLARLADRNTPYSYLFREMYALCRVDEKRTSLRTDLRTAYFADDKQALLDIADKRIPEIIKRVNAFYESVRMAWYTDHKPFGFEVQDIRLGGLVRRMENTRRIIKAYIKGEVDKIAELEQENLSPNPTNNEYNDAGYYNLWEENVTYGCLIHKIYN